jgi:hypothetical protein
MYPLLLLARDPGPLPGQAGGVPAGPLRQGGGGGEGGEAATAFQDTKCEMLTFRDPYLRLGPFLLEHRNKAGNYIAQVETKMFAKLEQIYVQIHDLMSDAEMDSIKAKTSGKMKATPYSIGGKQVAFSYDRTSKVHYLSERMDDDMVHLTRRLELAMGYTIYTPGFRFTAENYQIMNYGLGGKISLHKDADSKVRAK